MNVFNFIAGLAIGALKIQKGIISENDGFQWFKEDGYWTLHIYHYRVFTLQELLTAKYLVDSFCECKNMIIGTGLVKFVVVINEGGGE